MFVNFGNSGAAAIALIVCGLIAQAGGAADSQGTEFHTVFLPNVNQNDQTTVNISLTLINADASRPANVSITAFYFFPNRTFQAAVSVDPRSANTVQLPSDIIWSYTSDGFNGIADQRVHVYSTIPITVIANNFDQSGSGDRYTVLPANAAGNRYAIALAESGSERLNYVQLIAIDRPANVSIQIVSANASTMLSAVLDPAAYSIQYYYATSNAFTAYVSSSGGKLALVVGTSGRRLGNSQFDHQAFMPLPVSSDLCPGMIEVNDQHPTTANDETASSQFFVVGPDPNCQLPFSATGTNGTLDGEIVPNTLISATDVSGLGSAIVFASIAGYVQVTRIVGGGPNSALGASLSIVPSPQEFVTGETYFQTLSNGETILVVGDTATAGSGQLDGTTFADLANFPLPSLTGYFARTYTIAVAGVHSVQSPGFYSLAVFGGVATAGYSYVPAYNLRPPIATTPASSSAATATGTTATTATTTTTTTTTSTATATGSMASTTTTNQGSTASAGTDTTTVATTQTTGTTTTSTTTTAGATSSASPTVIPTLPVPSGLLFYTAFLPNLNEKDASTVNLSLTLINPNNTFTATVNIDGVFYDPRGVYNATVTVDPSSSITVLASAAPKVPQVEQVQLPSSFIWLYTGQGMQQQPDQRVRIVSTNPITVIASNMDRSGSGDRYIVPPTSALSTSYAISVPPSGSNRLNFVSFIPFEGFVTINVTVYASPTANIEYYTLPTDSAFGTIQHYYAHSYGFTVYVTSSGGRLAILAGTSARRVSTSSFDHQAFMPLPVMLQGCTQSLSDIHPSNANDGTTSQFFVVGPSDTCAVPYTVSGNSSINLNTPFASRVDPTDVAGLSTRVTLSTNSALMQVTRILGLGETVTFGASLSIVPSVTQFVYGTTRFQTFTDGDFVQLIGDQLTAENVTLDGVPILDLSNFPFPSLQGFFSNRYSIPSAGLHSIDSPRGQYTLLVFGGNVAAAYSYVPAFKIQSPGPAPSNMAEPCSSC